MNTIKGVFIALTTPFDNDEVSARGFEHNLGFYNRFDLSGYVVLGSTGENVFLSDDESEKAAAVVAEAAAPGRILIAGTARESARRTVEFTNRLASLGYHAALIRTPSYYKSKMTPEALKAFYLEVADQSRVPVLIYHFPQNTGISLDSSLVVDIAAHPHIAGIKDSSGNIAAVGEVVPHVRNDFSFLVGSGSLLLPGMLLGASGAVLAVANAAPELCSRLYRRILDGRLEEAKALQSSLAALHRVLVLRYGIAGLKYAMDLLGLKGGAVRSPLLPLPNDGREEIQSLLSRLGLMKK